VPNAFACVALDWRHRERPCAGETLAIENALHEGLSRAFTSDLYWSKCSVLLEHVFETFSDVQGGLTLGR
jgi:hypothetical protein